MASNQAQASAGNAAAVINAKLLETGQYSDLTLKYGGDTFRVHRNIICPRSKVFDAECNGPFSEAQKREVEIGAPTASRAAVKRMLSFFYTNNYEDIENDKATYVTGMFHPTLDKDSQNVALMNNVHVYAMSDFYVVDDLKALASQKFQSRLNFPSAEMGDIIHEVFDHTYGHQDVLRRSLVSYVARHRTILFAKDDFVSKVTDISEFQSMLVLQLCTRFDAEQQQLNQAHTNTTNDHVKTIASLRQELLASKMERDNALRARDAAETARATAEIAKTDAEIAKNKLERERNSQHNTQSRVSNLASNMNALGKCPTCTRPNDKAYRVGGFYKLTCGGCHNRMIFSNSAHSSAAAS